MRRRGSDAFRAELAHRRSPASAALPPPTRTGPAQGGNFDRRAASRLRARGHPGVGATVLSAMLLPFAGSSLCAAGCDLAPPSLDAPGPSVLDTTPEEGALDVLRRGPFVARFDRLLLPRTVSRGTVRLESGAVRALLSVRYDVLTRTVVAVPLDDAPIAADVGWRLVLDGVRDLDGQPMRAPHTVPFRTGSDPGPDPSPPPAAGYAEVAPIFAARCTGSGCHGPGPTALGLDLSSPAGIRETALNRPARTIASGALGAEGGAGAPVLAGLPIVEVIAGRGRPETSYLVYAVLGDPAVPGVPMPPALRDDPAAGLTDAEKETLVAWIQAGAPLP